MIVAGIDVGSLTAKAVILDDNRILAAQIIRDLPDPVESARRVIAAALDQAGLGLADLACCVGTGYGREQIPFAHSTCSEIACHGKGAQWHDPDIRMVIDIGGQDAKAIRLDSEGNIVRYAYNDKCASGTGRFLEIMAEALGVPLDEMGALSLSAREVLSISNQCVIFAETEIVSLVNEGAALPAVVKGLHRALAHRVAALAKGIELETGIAFTGGVAKNPGMFAELESALGIELRHIDPDPQITGALGAALFAAQQAA